MESRTPPVEIRRKLRKEVNYGCPICRSPFLAYHHFNPAWSPQHIHNVKGMIALCPIHHAQADIGTWTIIELENMKNSSHAKSIDGQIHWSLGKSIIVAGRNIFIGNHISAKIQGNEVFRLREIKENTVVIHALLWNENMQPLLRIIDNDVVLQPELVSDFICTASGDSIQVDVKDSSSFFEVKYQRANLEYIVDLLDDELKESMVINLIEKQVVDGKISLIELRFRISTNLFDIDCRVPEIILDFTKLGYDKAKLSGRFFGPTGCLRFVSTNPKTNKSIEMISLGNSL